MLASYAGQIETTRLLLQEFRADPNVLNDRGQSPLAGAVFKNEPEIVGLLVSAGADLDLGESSAEECLKVFGLEGVFGSMFGEARERRWRREGLMEGS